MKRNRSKGFTLIEMLVVIAIIAVLVAVIIPTITAATTKANAATDAANLRSILGEANAVYLSGEKDPVGTAEFVSGENVKSKSFKNADLFLVYTVPGFIDVYFVDGGILSGDDISGGMFYGLDYFSDIAEQGESSKSTSKPIFPSGYNPVWHLLSDNG